MFCVRSPLEQQPLVRDSLHNYLDLQMLSKLLNSPILQQISASEVDEFFAKDAALHPLSSQFLDYRDTSSPSSIDSDSANKEQTLRTTHLTSPSLNQRTIENNVDELIDANCHIGSRSEVSAK
ncbi:hypothetical protein Tcan_03908 [Toxocara canis]|uniref:Uncharacterized protein n=1 Tax=Toxocara canis TaxID=6265 RepID=A0A0B2UUD6_TOXCA|nr:hypothetical protein Tcan_03908 [Toxocara canis]